MKRLIVMALLATLGGAAGAETVSVTVSTTTILRGNTGRGEVNLVNYGPSTVYLGKSTSQTSGSAGYILKSSDTLTLRGYTGALYGVTGSGTGDIRYIETAR